VEESERRGYRYIVAPGGLPSGRWEDPATSYAELAADIHPENLNVFAVGPHASRSRSLNNRGRNRLREMNQIGMHA
jgi:hypothetical protein